MFFFKFCPSKSWWFRYENVMEYDFVAKRNDCEKWTNKNHASVGDYIYHQTQREKKAEKQVAK